MSNPIQVYEEYKDAMWFITIGGFTSSQDFYNFLRSWGVEKHICGYPVYAIMTALNKARKNRTQAGGLQEQLTEVRIEKEKTMIAIKRRDWLPRHMAISRMRMTLTATASKIKYAIKMAAPRVCGLFSIVDIENVITEYFNGAIDQLYSEAEQLISWEDYGQDVQGTDFQQGGTGLAEVKQEDTSEGSCEVDPVQQQGECP